MYPHLIKSMQRHHYYPLDQTLRAFHQRVGMGQYAPIKSWSKQRLLLLWNAARMWVAESRDSKALRREMAALKAATGLCWVCCALPAVHRHHIISLKRGGDNRWDNLVNLCEICHKSVHDGDRFRDRREAELIGKFLFVPKRTLPKPPKPARVDKNWTPHKTDMTPRLIKPLSAT